MLKKDTLDRIYNVNLFRITTQHALKKKTAVISKLKFSNILKTVITDTGPKVSVFSLQQAKKWKLFDKMFPSNTKLRPFNSHPIKVEG